MNANDLWSGNDYAYARYGQQRNKRYYPPREVDRVRIVRIVKRKDFGNERMSAYAEVVKCDHESGEMLDNARPYEVRVRDIFMRWEEYEDETNRRQIEQERLNREREATRLIQQAEHERVMAERREKAQMVKTAMDKLGMPRPTLYQTTIEFNREEFEAWLAVH